MLMEGYRYFWEVDLFDNTDKGWLLFLSLLRSMDISSFEFSGATVVQ